MESRLDEQGWESTMRSRIVAHYLDKHLVKGYSEDFAPHKETFHLIDESSGDMREIRISELKAVFFVKSFQGDRDYQRQEEAERHGFGRRIRVHFRDGETVIGYTSGYSPDRVGFFFFPADPQENNERILVVNAAIDKVEFL